ncbi:DNA primase [Streptomyces montanus]|uniref:DNA primase n=1 Tax=Streptomyces montanus TaxID=2580423 RepID=A0A5R9FKW5_9ACTN|nr:DNA primase [Streptomyces montanus]TLS41224.1 DNA primase [Streptomyces montanus]
MNRVGLGLAVGAGYVLGRTKKMKLAFAVGTLVAGRRMRLSPRMLVDVVDQQLRNNPQFKEVGDQLREELRGVGKAASGALVERQIGALADRLHGRTAEVRERIAGVAPDVPGFEDEEVFEGFGDFEEPEDREESEEREEPDQASPDEAPAKKAPAKKVAAKKAQSKKPVKKMAATAPAKKAASKKVAAKTAKKAPGKKTAAAQDSARRTTRRRAAEGGRDDD